MQRGGNAGVMQTDASPSLISLRRRWIMNEAPYTSSMLKVSSVHAHNLLIVFIQASHAKPTTLTVSCAEPLRWGQAELQRRLLRPLFFCLTTVKHKADTISCLAAVLKPHFSCLFFFYLFTRSLFRTMCTLVLFQKRMPHHDQSHHPPTLLSFCKLSSNTSWIINDWLPFRIILSLLFIDA